MLTPLSEAQDCPFFAFIQFRPADALLSLEPGADQGTLFAHNVVQGYIWDCVLSIYFFNVVFVVLDRLNTPPPRGAVGDVTFHSGYLSFPHLTPAMLVVRGKFWRDFSLVLAPVFPFLSTKVCIVPFLWFVRRRVFSAPPPLRHTDGTRQVFDGWFALF